MSDLSMYELDDIIWDDFDRSDDHIVPHPSNARTSRNSLEGDTCKKPRRETTPVLSHTGNLDASDNNICQGTTERESKPLDKKTIMMEKESASHAPPGVFNASCDGEIVKDMPNLGSDDTRMSNNCFKSSYVTSAAGENNSYSYPLTQISQSEDLCFVNNNCGDKESGDLLYYGWPDIGNFEDVDKMLRSCDSSFGLGVTENDDELGWFTSDQIGGSTEEALKMDFKFTCPEPSGLKNMLSDHDSGESNNQRSSCISESKDELNYKDQINLQKKHSKHQNKTEGIGSSGSFYQIDNNRLSSNNKSDQVFTSMGNRQQYRNLELDSFGQMQSNTCYDLHSDYPYQTTNNPILSGIKSEHDKGLDSPSTKGSSYASNQGQSMEMESCAAEINEQKQGINSQGFQPLYMGSSNQMDMMFQSPKGVLVSADKQGAKEVESQSDMEGVQKSSLEVPESSCVSSELDEISLEATSFRQLRQVMEQLDLRTKLCIRDSLYRLARSAEQRHNNPSASDINDLAAPLMPDTTNNKCSGFIDIETDTNPIDRSVAHLLFHRPTESSNLPHKQNVNQSMMSEKLVCEEEAAGESNDRN